MSSATNKPDSSRASHRGRATGQALVEFALVFPIMVLLLFGAVDLGRAVYAYVTIANAARDAARVAAVNQILTSAECSNQKPVENKDDPHWSIQACAVSAAISLGVQPSDVHVSYGPPPFTSTLTCTAPQDAAPYPSPGTLDIGCIATVTVEYAYTPLTPVISAMFPSIGMTSTSQVPIERLFP